MRGTAFLIVAVASAEEGAPEVYEVRAEPEAAHPGATVTVLDLERRAGEQTSVAELVDEVPGVQVGTVGGLGAFSAISIRGSTPSQVAVYLGGVPMNRGAFGVVDLSEFAVENIDRIVVWSGLPPVDRMGAGLGGAVDLYPRRAPGGELRASGGSFAARGALVRAGDRPRPWFYSTAASYLGSEGDFPYLDHNVRFDPDDDVVRSRAHNGFDQAAGTVYASREGAIDVRLVQDVFYKSIEIAGTLNAPPALAPALDTWRSVTHLRAGRPGLLEGAAYATYQLDHYRDPLNEIGVGAQDQTGRTLAAGGELRGTFAAGPTALVVVPQVHHESYAQEESLGAAGAGDLEARRVVLGGGVSDAIALLGGRLVVEPAVRFDRYADDVEGGEARTHVLASPRGGVRATVASGLDLRASGGRYHRAPTFFEMFGDRGFVVGNPDLGPETGVAADAGVVWRGPLRAEATFHFAEVDDLVVLVQNSQQSVQARNIGQARLGGAEIALSIEPWKRLRLQASYAYLRPINLVEERQLPGRARHETYGRADTGPWPLGPMRAGVFADGEFSSGTYLDTANLLPLPPRVFVGAGVKLQPRRLQALTVTVEGKNLLDARTETVEIDPGDREVVVAVQDYLGYALPGRAVYATARMTF